MFYSVLLIGVVVLIVYSAKRWEKLSKPEQKEFSKKIAIWGGLGVVFALVATGRANVITGLLAGFIAVASQAKQLVGYFPAFKKIFGESAAADNAGSDVDLTDMSRQQAADVLGVEIGASPEEIRLAHKKLMQKIHPDRGGSELLAKQINTAKDVLLK